jgi:hypothetical protein
VQQRSYRAENFGHETSLGGSPLMHTGTFAPDIARPDESLRDYVKACERKQQTQRRLLWLQSLWDDTARFDAIIASGRYLKLCTLIEWASENDEIAARRLVPHV